MISFLRWNQLIKMNKLFTSIILLILLSLNLYSQKSNLERFEVNLISGCAPLEVQIVDEDVDSTATVIQYDFNYNNLSFNPSSTTFVKHFIYRGIDTHKQPAVQDNFTAGYFNTTSAINAIIFRFETGNIGSGTLKLYGLKDS